MFIKFNDCDVPSKSKLQQVNSLRSSSEKASDNHKPSQLQSITKHLAGGPSEKSTSSSEYECE